MIEQQEPAWKARWRKIDRGCKLLHDFCKERNYSMVTHDSHGFYIDATIGGKNYVLDPTPETVWKEGVLIKSYEPGTVIVYRGRENIGQFNALTAQGFQGLKGFLLSLEGKYISPITGELK